MNATAKKSTSSKKSAPTKKGPAGKSAAARGTLLGVGDSWLCYRSGPLVQQRNIYKSLIDLGYLSAQQSPYAQAGMALETVAGWPIDHQMYLVFEDMLVRQQPPQAIILSAGGVDCVKNALPKFVNPKAMGTPPVDAMKWQSHLNTLRGYYVAILSKFKMICDRQAAAPIRVLLNGYDHPIADGRWLLGGAGQRAWLYGWLVTDLRYSVAEATSIMTFLIDGLNVLQKGLVGDPGLGDVRHVDNRGVLRNTFGAGSTDLQWFGQSGYQLAWQNELHPKPAAFKALADYFDAALLAP